MAPREQDCAPEPWARIRWVQRAGSRVGSRAGNRTGARTGSPFENLRINFLLRELILYNIR